MAVMDSDDEHEGGGKGGALVGFLFGNVDENLQLEDDYLGRVCGPTTLSA